MYPTNNTARDTDQHRHIDMNYSIASPHNGMHSTEKDSSE